jgi:crossover junction endonuclease MUS81
MIWIAKDGNTEVVLDFIVERKSVGDLAASIADGRYKEQRYRLRESGISNVMYIIEGESLNQGRMPQQKLESALVSLIMSDGFFMRRTCTVDMTIELLAEMTNVIREMLDRDGLDMHIYNDENGNNMELNVFNMTMAKNSKILTTEEIFGRQLGCIDSCSTRTVESILKEYQTPRQLANAFEKHGKHVLSTCVIKSNFNTPIGKVANELSEKMHKLYTMKKYL